MAAPDLITAGIPSLISAASGLIGVVIGGWITSRNQRLERRQRFSRDQLTEFYAPMLGIRERLRARSTTRLSVRDAAGAVWPRLMAEAREVGTEHLRENREDLSPAFGKIIEDDNRQLEAEEIPMYRQMVDLFTKNMHFAEPSTRQYFGSLVGFVELWERWLRGALPAEVVKRIGPDEQNLFTFYEDLEKNFSRLQAALKE